ncbi:GNAT family acetyltransferase [Mycolicibacterium conceptionense]|uniref:GNAT family acetyltransferase n=1 Tax=Mycolicibacterium conceptionense TaxID=451644 RepID=A0A1A0PJ80_9MYCO|nr:MULTISPECIES: GNAT family N-acetyltransferase [Mycolicibacterium]MCW1822490.1 GNAT family N-acetyltransferase [Mycolicibacterium senegalense]OBB09762.1 GNAT family acetyltransferase [Mycolicibacterium conceptionense]OBE96983.1 GNAT family acetyltransferase [Mycolicibacterium conceptionense]OBF15265.1 GNAT family acetyltransferase [Mycolicibacterium conceptionense]OBF34728.1 GNAT family acetyltransferase [Mycolicibacterium conceptionense]
MAINGGAHVREGQLFCGVELARRIEKAESDLIVAATRAARDRGADGLVLPVAGGFACFAEPNSPMNKVVGLGFDGLPDEAVLGEIERAFAARGSATQVELSNLADPEVTALLSGRGYRLEEFENVLGRPVGDEPAPVSDVQVRRADDLTAWVNVVVEGFAHPDGEGPVSHEQFPADIVERAERDMEKAGATAYVALCDSVIAGGAMMRVAGSIAQLAGAATAPAYRRRGVQAALLATRLHEAAGAGCEIAVVTTAPGSKSQHNVQRRGFQLLYTRAILVKPAESVQ